MKRLGLKLFVILFFACPVFAAQITIDDIVNNTTPKSCFQDCDSNFTELYGKWTSLGADYDTSTELEALFNAKQGTLSNEAGLYSALSDVTDFVQPSEMVGANETYGSGWDGDTGLLEKDDIYDYLHQFDSDDDGSFEDESWFPSGGSLADDSLLEVKLDATNSPTDDYILSYDSATGGFTWVSPGSGSGDLLADGTVPLTANWDLGAYTITGTQFISDIADGTAPFVVTSTTLVSNLNADSLDGESASAFQDANNYLTDIAGLTPTAGNLLGWNSAGTDIENKSSLTLQFSESAEFEGSTADDYETTLTVTDPTADRTVTLRDASGTVAISGDTFTGDVTGTLDTDGSTALTIASGSVGADELASTAVTAGSYTNTSITVDADGRITAASSGSGSSVSNASSAEINTGTDTTKVVTPDALAGSYAFTKDVGWTITDSDTATEEADGTQFYVIPASLNGMNLVDVTAAVHDLNSATGGNTTVVVRRVRSATAVDMTSTGVTIDYDEYFASDETVNTSNDDVQTGDKIFIDVDDITTGAAQKGLSVTCLFRLP